MMVLVIIKQVKCINVISNIFRRLTDRKICLLDKNDTDTCPQGWNYSGKFNSENYNGQNINICCKNT